MEMESVIEIDIEASEAKQGLSAYEVYLQNGGTMTEEEWLESLQGKTPTIGENENWFIDDVDTGLPSRGEKGDSVVYDLFVVDSTAIQFMLGTYSDNVIGHAFDEDITNIIEEHINDAYERGFKTLVLKTSFVRSESDSTSSCYERLYTWSNGSGGNLQNKPKSIYLNAVTDVTQTSIADSTIVVSLTWSGDTATVTDARVHGYRSKFLATNYSSEFTPTKDYHPATKKYVDDSIAEAEQASVDLSGYYTKEETDAAIANIDIPEPTRIYELTLTNFQLGQNYSPTEADKIAVSELITKINADGVDYPLILLYDKYGGCSFIRSGNPVTAKNNTWYLHGFSFRLSDSRRSTSQQQYYSVSFGPQGTWENDIYTCSGINLTSTVQEYISKTNTTEFTPTGDYHPATKKYVDDSIANIDIPEVDLTNYYTKEETDTAIDEINDNTKTFYIYSRTVETIQPVIDAMKSGKRVIIRQKGSSATTSYGAYEGPAFYSPDTSSIDWETYEGKITFKSDWWMSGYDNSFRSGQVDLVVKWAYFQVTLSAGGIVTNVSTENYSNHNSIGNVNTSLPVLGKSNEIEYTPTKDYHPATKKYADDTSLSTIIDHMSAEEFTYHDTNSIPEVTYEISKLGTNDYEFVLDETTGYYTSNNKDVHNSYALSKVNIITDKSIRIKVSYINYSQSYYDYGMFSNIDTELTDSATADTENVFLSTKSSSMTNTVREFYMDVPAGEHFFTVKYIKNASTSYNDDTLQFKVETVCELVTSTLASKKYVDDSVANVGGGACPVYDFPFVNYTAFSLRTTLNTVTSTDSTTKTRASEIINDMKANGFGAAIINFYNKDQANSMAYMCISQFGAVSRNSTDFTFMAFNKTQHAYTQNYEFENVRVDITGTWTDDVFTCTKVQVQGISINFENGIASKKYVDDAISAAITTVLEGEY